MRTPANYMTGPIGEKDNYSLNLSLATWFLLCSLQRDFDVFSRTAEM